MASMSLLRSPRMLRTRCCTAIADTHPTSRTRKIMDEYTRLEVLRLPLIRSESIKMRNRTDRQETPVVVGVAACCANSTGTCSISDIVLRDIFRISTLFFHRRDSVRHEQSAKNAGNTVSAKPLTFTPRIPLLLRLECVEVTSQRHRGPEIAVGTSESMGQFSFSLRVV